MARPSRGVTLGRFAGVRVHVHSPIVTQSHMLVRVGGGVMYKEGTNSGQSCINVTLR